MFNLNLDAVPLQDGDTPAVPLVMPQASTPPTAPTKAPGLRTNAGQVARLAEMTTALKANDLTTVAKLADGWNLNRSDEAQSAFIGLVRVAKDSGQLDAALLVNREPSSVADYNVAKQALELGNLPVVAKYLKTAAEFSYRENFSATNCKTVLDASLLVTDKDVAANAQDDIATLASRRANMAVLTYVASKPELAHLVTRKVLTQTAHRLTRSSQQVQQTPTDTANWLDSTADSLKQVLLLDAKLRRNQPYYLREAGEYQIDKAKAVHKVLSGRPFSVKDAVYDVLTGSRADSLDCLALNHRLNQQPELRDSINLSDTVTTRHGARTLMHGILRPVDPDAGGLVEALGLQDKFNAMPLADLKANVPPNYEGIKDYALLVTLMRETKHPEAHTQACFELRPETYLTDKPATPYLLNNAAFGAMQPWRRNDAQLAGSPAVVLDMSNPTLVNDVSSACPQFASQQLRPYVEQHVMGTSEPSLLYAGEHVAGLLLSLAAKEENQAAVTDMIKHRMPDGSSFLHQNSKAAVFANGRIPTSETIRDSLVAASVEPNANGVLPSLANPHSWLAREQAGELIKQGALKVTPVSRAELKGTHFKRHALTLSLADGKGNPLTEVKQFPKAEAVRKHGNTVRNQDGTVTVTMNELKDAEHYVKEMALNLIANTLIASMGETSFMPEGWGATKQNVIVQSPPKKKEMER